MVIEADYSQYTTPAKTLFLLEGLCVGVQGLGSERCSQTYFYRADVNEGLDDL